MCGICGFMGRQNITQDALRHMNDTLTHRGPDDAGAEIYPLSDGSAVGLAQRRLSILDLSAQGHQPMHSADGRLSVILNGEIYNFLDLKKELTDYPFVSGTDTEVILAAYLRWGIDCLARLQGMFSIALYDRDTEEVFLARDRIGKKPLYYWKNDTSVVFSSELKALMACPGFAPEIRRDVLSRYLFQLYINAPDSIFKDVWKLEPGSVLTWRKGEISVRKYWDIKQVYHEQKSNLVTDYAEAKAGLKERLQAAVRKRMIADVPLGTFLSGGYDSSLITAMAQECASGPVKTFAIGFNEPKYNEAEYAKAVAAHLGTDHTELYIGEKEMFALVESIPKYYDEPFADSSQIPMMLVSELAKSKVTVALSGDGGDEFFCGYNVYPNVRKAQQLDKIGGLVHGICSVPGLHGLESKMPFKVRVIAGNRNPETKSQFGAGNYETLVNAMVGEVPDMLPVHYPWESAYREKNWQMRRMLLDMETYLPGDILCKVDRASMKYALEARCPILDTDVMEYSYRIPMDFKYDHGDKKHILKDIAYDYIPRELLDRPKTGFGVPLDQWLRGPLRERLEAYADESYLKKQGIFDAAYTSAHVRSYLEKGDAGPATGANYSKIFWPFFVFQQWYEYWKMSAGRV